MLMIVCAPNGENNKIDYFQLSICRPRPNPI